MPVLFSETVRLYYTWNWNKMITVLPKSPWLLTKTEVKNGQFQEGDAQLQQKDTQIQERDTEVQSLRGRDE